MADKIISDYSLAGTIDPVNDLFLMEQFATNSYKSISRDTILGVTGQPADISSSQVLTNKTIGATNLVTQLDNVFTLQDNSDPTKQAQFQLSGITTATTRTYTLPNASSTLVDIATAQTLTNKTLTSPTITGGSITNSTISVDSISEFTSANGVTVDGLNIKDGKLNTNNSVVTANITDTAVTPAKLLAGTGTSWAWQSWTPTWTNLTTGNGVNSSVYTQIGKTIVARLRFVLGNTSAVTGAVSFTLPVTSTSVNSQDSYLGYGRLTQPGVGNATGVARWTSTTVGSLAALNSSTTYVTETAVNTTVPVTWADTGYIQFTLIYEAA